MLPSGSPSVCKSIVTWNSMGMWCKLAPWVYYLLVLFRKIGQLGGIEYGVPWKRKEVAKTGCSRAYGRSSMDRLQDDIPNRWSRKTLFVGVLWMDESRWGRRHGLPVWDREEEAAETGAWRWMLLTPVLHTHTHNRHLRFSWLKVQTSAVTVIFHGLNHCHQRDHYGQDDLTMLGLHFTVKS